MQHYVVLMYAVTLKTKSSLMDRLAKLMHNITQGSILRGKDVIMRAMRSMHPARSATAKVPGSAAAVAAAAAAATAAAAAAAATTADGSAKGGAAMQHLPAAAGAPQQLPDGIELSAAAPGAAPTPSTMPQSTLAAPGARSASGQPLGHDEVVVGEPHVDGHAVHGPLGNGQGQGPLEAAAAAAAGHARTSSPFSVADEAQHQQQPGVLAGFGSVLAMGMSPPHSGALGPGPGMSMRHSRNGQGSGGLRSATPAPAQLQQPLGSGVEDAGPGVAVDDGAAGEGRGDAGDPQMMARGPGPVAEACEEEEGAAAGSRAAPASAASAPTSGTGRGSAARWEASHASGVRQSGSGTGLRPHLKAISRLGLLSSVAQDRSKGSPSKLLETAREQLPEHAAAAAGGKVLGAAAQAGAKVKGKVREGAQSAAGKLADLLSTPLDDATGQAVSLVLADLFPTTFVELVPVCCHKVRGGRLRARAACAPGSSWDMHSHGAMLLIPCCWQHVVPPCWAEHI